MLNMEQEFKYGFGKARKLACLTKLPEPTVLIMSEYWINALNN